jgi:hypothetical protein
MAQPTTLIHRATGSSLWCINTLVKRTDDRVDGSDN